ncbi:hypothetical protein BGZ57DRAFT_864661 [Hyaloscypha finlandica]|nr:hypothetical protein BGZ57DRAFT_864661 [Hyaloscypha finlandica]
MAMRSCAAASRNRTIVSLLALLIKWIHPPKVFCEAAPSKFWAERIVHIHQLSPNATVGLKIRFAVDVLDPAAGKAHRGTRRVVALKFEL